jgi:hypothetical protein
LRNSNPASTLRIARPDGANFKDKAVSAGASAMLGVGGATGGGTAGLTGRGTAGLTGGGTAGLTGGSTAGLTGGGAFAGPRYYAPASYDSNAAYEGNAIACGRYPYPPCKKARTRVKATE